MHIDDMKSELLELAAFLNGAFEANTQAQSNLIIELAVMKMQQMGGLCSCQSDMTVATGQ